MDQGIEKDLFGRFELGDMVKCSSSIGLIIGLDERAVTVLWYTLTIHSFTSNGSEK